MAYLGLDYGDKRIGVALQVGDYAQPLTTLINSEAVISNLAKIIEEEKITGIVLGLPEESQKEKVEEFGEKLKNALKLNLYYQDEVLTSKIAQELSIITGKTKKKRKHLDATAAAIILQEYLDNSPQTSL